MISEETIDNTYKSLNKDAESAGYHLNPDVDFTKNLIKGLLVNEKRYGYWSCPCRLASGEKSKDIDIICPCDYRDPDLNEFGMCYCGLYVSKNIFEGKEEIKPIPERRPTIKERKKKPIKPATGFSTLSKTVWRCKVCGYLCARDEPPEVCPICKAKKDRFEKFIF